MAGCYSINDTTANIMNIIASHLAISTDMPATPRAPTTPAMMASMKNPIAKLSKPAIFCTLLDIRVLLISADQPSSSRNLAFVLPTPVSLKHINMESHEKIGNNLEDGLSNSYASLMLH